MRNKLSAHSWIHDAGRSKGRTLLAVINKVTFARVSWYWLNSEIEGLGTVCVLLIGIHRLPTRCVCSAVQTEPVSTLHVDLGAWRCCFGASSCREPCVWWWSFGWWHWALPSLRPFSSASCNAGPRTVLTSRCAPSRQNRCSTPSRYRRSCSSWRPWRSSQCCTLSSAWSCGAPGSCMQRNGRPLEAAVLREATTAPQPARAARHRTTSSACSVSTPTVSCVLVASYGLEILSRWAGSGSLIPARRNRTGKEQGRQHCPDTSIYCRPVGQLRYLLYRPKLANDLSSRV